MAILQKLREFEWMASLGQMAWDALKWSVRAMSVVPAGLGWTEGLPWSVLSLMLLAGIYLAFGVSQLWSSRGKSEEKGSQRTTTQVSRDNSTATDSPLGDCPRIFGVLARDNSLRIRRGDYGEIQNGGETARVEFIEIEDIEIVGPFAMASTVEAAKVKVTGITNLQCGSQVKAVVPNFGTEFLVPKQEHTVGNDKAVFQIYIADEVFFVFRLHVEHINAQAEWVDVGVTWIKGRIYSS